MIPRFGKCGSDIPLETQFLLLEATKDSSLHDEFCSDKDSEDLAPDNTFYILFLPFLDGQFRATLQGTPSNELQLCIESGLFVASHCFLYKREFNKVVFEDRQA